MGKEGKKNRSPCSTSRSLEIIGDKWSLLILRDYIFAGKREYSDFLTSPEGISTNILAERLEWLVQNEMLEKFPHPTNGKKFYYDITDKGFDLIIVIMELARWGWKYIPGAWTPDEVKSAYKADPKKFVPEWKRRIQKRTASYLMQAKSFKA